jgi:diacylglycerol kinase family enzyme
MTDVTHTNVVARPRAGRGIVLCVRASGEAHDALPDVRARFPDHDVDPCRADQLSRRVRDAQLNDVGPAGAVGATARPFVGVAGDDRAIRVAAAALAHSDTALLPIPTGCDANLAGTLGIATIDDAVKAVECGTENVIDLGRVNGHSFVNSSSVGLSSRVFDTRHGSRRAVVNMWANARALSYVLRAHRRVTVKLDGRPVRAWFVFVGNGCYGERMNEHTARESLSHNLLDVRVLRADQRFARARLVGAAMLGHLASSPVLDRRTCREVLVEGRAGSPVEVEHDGDRERLEVPLRYASDAQALRVLVPS